MTTFGRRCLPCIVLAACAGVAAAPDAEGALINGSFEEGTGLGAWTFFTLPINSTNITGWTVTSGGIDWINLLWDASNGQLSIDLNSTVPGRIEQTFTTEPGQRYRVEFDLGGNPEGTPNLKELAADIDGVEVDTFTYDVAASGSVIGTIQWVGRSFEFVASGAQTTLGFSSLTEGAFGPALDNVRVTLVPEPAGAALLLAAGVAGLGTRPRRLP